MKCNNYVLMCWYENLRVVYNGAADISECYESRGQWFKANDKPANIKFCLSTHKSCT